MSDFTIDPGTVVGAIHLRVSDSGRALDFYTGVLGFDAASWDDHVYALSAGGAAPVIVLSADAQALSKPRGTTGLYHYAIRVPERRDLAQVLLRLQHNEYALQGASDHGVSEALYLADPDGNGIEIYVDRPREAWPTEDDDLQMVTAQLDIEGLLATLGGASAGGAQMPAGTDIGHVHLHVADLAATERFYCDALGMALTQRYGESALFFSAGGYHHHVGANVWAGVGAPPPPDNAVGLRYFTLRLPSETSLSELRAHLLDRGEVVEIRDEGIRILDPSNNAVIVTTEAPEWEASDHHES